jgi:hypothetical protein
VGDTQTQPTIVEPLSGSKKVAGAKEERSALIAQGVDAPSDSESESASVLCVAGVRECQPKCGILGGTPLAVRYQ